MSEQEHGPAAGAASERLTGWARRALRCPATGEELVDGPLPDGSPALVAREAGLAYPVRDGVPILLAHEAVSIA